MNHQRTQIKPGQKLDLLLTEAERQHILDDLTGLDRNLKAIIRKTAPRKPLKMTLDDLDRLSAIVAAGSKDAKSKKSKKSLELIFDKITDLLPKVVNIQSAKKPKTTSDQAAEISKWTTQMLAVVEQLKIKNKVVDTIVADKLDRNILAAMPSVSGRIGDKLDRDHALFTVAEVCGMTKTIAKELPGAGIQRQLGLLMVARTLMNGLQQWIAEMSEAKLGK